MCIRHVYKYHICACNIDGLVKRGRRTRTQATQSLIVSTRSHMYASVTQQHARSPIDIPGFCTYVCVCGVCDHCAAQLYIQADIHARTRWRAAGPKAAHTWYNDLTLAVFHALMFALKLFALKNACEPSHTRSTPTESARTFSAQIHVLCVCARARVCVERGEIMVFLCS